MASSSSPRKSSLHHHLPRFSSKCITPSQIEKFIQRSPTHHHKYSSNRESASSSTSSSSSSFPRSPSPTPSSSSSTSSFSPPRPSSPHSPYPSPPYFDIITPSSHPSHHSPLYRSSLHNVERFEDRGGQGSVLPNHNKVGKGGGRGRGKKAVEVGWGRGRRDNGNIISMKENGEEKSQEGNSTHSGKKQWSGSGQKGKENSTQHRIFPQLDENANKNQNHRSNDEKTSNPPPKPYSSSLLSPSITSLLNHSTFSYPTPSQLDKRDKCHHVKFVRNQVGRDIVNPITGMVMITTKGNGSGSGSSGVAEKSVGNETQ